MKIFGSIFSILLIAQLALSKNIDSLENELSRNIPDSVEVNIYYSFKNRLNSVRSSIPKVSIISSSESINY